MLIIFFIFTVYFYGAYRCEKNYCEICPNHTLCKYKISGPSSTCSNYDYNALLTDNDISTIVDHINRRRNLIALGHSNFLPPAANMNKMSWSQELATSAQRWADQCDQELRPDKNDQCRDLEHMKIGQNIATITGPSATFNVKSFVEIWFMQSLVYDGSVTYYNDSRGNKSNQFTQLIWANTEKIGCGKAKFTINSIKVTIAERLVCNFAPTGNVHGKPLYIIGYAATQCSDNMQPDKFFSGLCSQPAQINEVNKNIKQSPGKMITVPSVSTSLLRIRNLFNYSVVKEIDPVYNNFKLMENDTKNECLQVNQKSRVTITQDNFFDAVKRSHTLRNENFWVNYRNNSQNIFDLHQHDKGHLRMYHEYEHKNEFDSIHPEMFHKDSRRYDSATTIHENKEQDYRHNINPQCTRNVGSKVFYQYDSECIPCKLKILQCTRKHTTRVCEDYKWLTSAPNSNDHCKCNNLPTACPSVNRCVKNTNCECVSIGCSHKPCHNMLRALGHTISGNVKRVSDFRNYDEFTKNSFNKHNHDSRIVDRGGKLSNHQTNFFTERREFDPYYSNSKRNAPQDDLNFKPFWQIDGYSNKKQPQLKSIRYTTLANRRNKKSKKTKSTPKIVFQTEHITLKVNNEQKVNNVRVTEKYLSFDELMHLRKFNTGNFSGRRVLNANSDDNDGVKLLRESNTLNSTENTEYTANTPFIRMKHCTRKLTCTWTAASLTDSAGSIIPGGTGGNVGSHTPPGYVEGCTRTSTCTRDYMNRNKMASIQIETTTPEFDSGDDEDYCERRSLHRRNCNESTIIKTNGNNISYKHFLNVTAIDYVLRMNTSSVSVGCFCYNNNTRTKRNYINENNGTNTSLNYRNVKREKKNVQSDHKGNVLSYGDLYYFVLNKIFSNWQNENSIHNCPCNNTNKIDIYNLLIYLSVFIFVK